jgi:hypothetical protein
MFATKFSKTLVSAVFIEIVLFWILLLAGKGIDKLMNDLYPNTDNKEQSIIVLNIQIVLITLLSVLGRPFIINQLGGEPKLQGMGLLYGFALLLNQTNFKERASSIV